MIGVCYTDERSGRVTKIPKELINESSDFSDKWIQLINPDEREIDFIASKTGIQTDFLKAALDEEERSRIEKEDDSLLIVVDVPTVIMDEKKTYCTYSTIPLGIIMKDNYFVTVCLEDTPILQEFGQSAGKVKSINIHMHSRTTFQLLFSIATKYLFYLRRIDKSSQRIQADTHKSMKNKELIELLDIENSLVYFSTSLRANAAVIEKLTRTNLIKKHEEDQDLIEDVAIENSQAIEMCNIYRDILSGTMDAYGSLISNNLNNVMKVLTSITLVLSVPTLIASLFGMNLDGIPGNTSYVGRFPWAFGLVCGLSLALTGLIALILKKKKMM